MSRPARCACLAALLLLGLAIAGCRADSPEQALRDTVARLQAAIDERDAGAVDDELSEDFVGNEGLDRTAARRLAAAMFLRHQQVDARIGPLDVVLHDEDHATVRFTAVVSGGAGGVLPDAAQVYRVTTGWRVEEGDWRLSSATWTPEL